MARNTKRTVPAVFLNNELLELWLMKLYDHTYEEAHERANRKYNWEGTPDR